MESNYAAHDLAGKDSKAAYENALKIIKDHHNKAAKPDTPKAVNLNGFDAAAEIAQGIGKVTPDKKAVLPKVKKPTGPNVAHFAAIIRHG